ncbi:MAG: hypothetical protein IEMM0008_1915 [bacterium]|nr:MAG: hypothetical protein IEMM0008_1915 [bacterium]
MVKLTKLAFDPSIYTKLILNCPVTKPVTRRDAINRVPTG